MTSHIFSQFDYWKECAEEGNTQAQYNLGLMYYNGEEVTRNYSEALKWFHKAAEDGLAKAQFMLGVMYENGFGVDKNEKAANSWYLKAAEQGYPEAIGKLAEHNANVQPQLKQKRRAEAQRRRHFKEQQKRAEELYCLGRRYLNGENVTQDYSAAIKCFSEAASLGHSRAKQKLAEERAKEQQRKRAEVLYCLGLRYWNGESVTQDYSAAIKCFEQADSLGHPEAKQKLTEAKQKLAEEQRRKCAEELYCLGFRYLTEENVTQDYSKPMKCFEQAASLGHAEAKQTLKLIKEQQNLKRAKRLYHRGLRYLNGKGVKQDYSAAIKCFEQADSLGHPEAKQKLTEAKQKLAEVKQKQAIRKHAEELYRRGYSYYHGQGVGQNRNKAINCYRSAAQMGCIPAQEALTQLGETW